MATNKEMELARAALIEYGCPDLAEVVRNDQSGIAVAPLADPDGERAYYKATQIVFLARHESLPCFDCWSAFRRYLIECDVYEACEHQR